MKHQFFLVLLMIGAAFSSACTKKPTRNFHIVKPHSVTQPALSTAQVIQQGNRFQMVLFSDACFEPGTARLNWRFYQEWPKLFRLLKPYAIYPIKIIAYTDNFLKPTVAKERTFKQAEAVATCLWMSGIASNRLIVVGAGSQFPVANNDDISVSRANRRVEIRIQNGFNNASIIVDDDYL